MPHRSIGQEGLSFATTSRSWSTLDRLSELIDWTPVACLLEPLYPASKGEPAWPPLGMFKALLLAVWHDLSDVKLAEALEDRASFRRFCGFSSSESTPERTAFVRFRRVVIAHGLDRVLFERVTADLKARAITVKTGTLVDATIIAWASETDEDGRWVKHKGRAAVHGFKAHVGADASTALVEQVAVTPANVNDGRAGPDALPEDPGVCRQCLSRRAFRQCGSGQGRVAAHRGHMWGRDEQETLARLDAWNAPIHRIRARIEKIFGTWKRSYGLRRMRWRGLARAAAQVRFTAIAYNLKRSLNILPA